MYWGGESEVVTGRLLRKLGHRDDLVLATKVFYPMTPGPNGGGLSRTHILAAIDASLERLGMDYVDLHSAARACRGPSAHGPPGPGRARVSNRAGGETSSAAPATARIREAAVSA